MAEDFELFTEEDKRSIAYGACVFGQVAIGATIGSIAGGQTLLGAAGGAVWGFFTCRYLEDHIKRKLFSQSGRLSEDEFRQALLATKKQFPLISKREALELLAAARHEAAKNPVRYRC